MFQKTNLEGTSYILRVRDKLSVCSKYTLLQFETIIVYNYRLHLKTDNRNYEWKRSFYLWYKFCPDLEVIFEMSAEIRNTDISQCM